MTINEKIEEDKIILEIEGKVDSLTTPQLQDAILLSLQKMSHLVLDCEGLNYISSAGLRALLMGEKTAQSKQGTMVLRNVSPTVLSILEMTGFIKILEIE